MTTPYYEVGGKVKSFLGLLKSIKWLLGVCRKEICVYYITCTPKIPTQSPLPTQPENTFVPLYVCFSTVDNIRLHLGLVITYLDTI